MEPILKLKELEKFPEMISEDYDYRGFHFQRMTKDGKWYVIHENSIVNWGQYRHDLEQWVDKHWEEVKEIVYEKYEFPSNYTTCFELCKFRNDGTTIGSVVCQFECNNSKLFGMEMLKADEPQKYVFCSKLREARGLK